MPTDDDLKVFCAYDAREATSEAQEKAEARRKQEERGTR